MKHKSETFEKFKEFQNEVENQHGNKIKAFWSDCGGKYLSHKFSNHLKSCGIVPQLTPPGTPQRNGVSERRNRTLLDMVWSMMSQSDLPLSFWGYALETATFTLNRVPSKSVVNSNTLVPTTAMRLDVTAKRYSRGTREYAELKSTNS